MKYYVSAIITGIILILFCAFSIYTKSTSTVLNVQTPAEFQIDLNSNNIIDDDENICIPGLQTFIFGKQSPDFAGKIDVKTLISMEYLADEFSKNKLFLKKVKVKLDGNRNQNCRYGEIYYDNEKYSDELIKAGFAKRDSEFNEENYKRNIEKAKKQDLVILNHHSYKYHNLDCEYGLQSHDYAIVQKKQLPKDAIPCRFCHKNIKEHSTPIVTNAKTTFSSGSIKIILPDFTKHNKPDTDCNTEACKALINEINKAKSTIDLALYGFGDSPKVYFALKAAKDRNVRIRLVYDREYDPNRDYYKGTEEIAKLASKSTSDYVPNEVVETNKLMHNKFIIFDNKTVYTGSMNLSKTGLSDFNANTIVIINSQEVANLYTKEFEQMLSGKFHNRKNKLGLKNEFNISGTKIKVLFSPYDTASTSIIPLIKNAKEYIYLPTFLITHKDISNALIQAKKRGVDVKILMDATNVRAKHSKHYLLRQSGIQLKTESYAGKMHSKTMIIDDKYLVVGSMNFSNSGENKNDENCLIIENNLMAKEYKRFFLYLWNKVPDFWLTHNAKPEGKDSPGSCSDGIDNDFDGQIDMIDKDCTPNNLK